MANFGMRIDLLKLKGAFMKNLIGRTGTKRCLIIPADDCDGIFLGEKGCYLNLTGIEMTDPKYKDTHCIKIDLPKEQREAMSEEDLRSVPILGGMYPIEKKQPTMTVTGTLDSTAFADDDFLPF